MAIMNIKKQLDLWDTLCKKTKHLKDNNYTARIIFDSLTKKIKYL